MQQNMALVATHLGYFPVQGK